MGLTSLQATVMYGGCGRAGLAAPSSCPSKLCIMGGAIQEDLLGHFFTVVRTGGTGESNNPGKPLSKFQKTKRGIYNIDFKNVLLDYPVVVHLDSKRINSQDVICYSKCIYTSSLGKMLSCLVIVIG